VYFFIIGIVFVLDRISKFLANKYLSVIDTKPLINNILNLTYSENTGAAFSILRDKTLFLAAFSAIVLIGLIVFLVKSIKKKEGKMLLLSLSMLIGGAAGNMYDRIVNGYVIDYFEVRFINFAIFNVADVFIVIGTFLLAIFILLEEKDKAK